MPSAKHTDAHRLPPIVVVAAPASGTGKTVFTLGLIAALRARGLVIACAKVGPDFIDPKFHACAAGRPCHTLDPWAMTPAQVRARAAACATGADVLVIEGVMGLYDGAADGSGSTADLAQWLGAPVILCIDAGRQGQSLAATVHGFATFRPDLQFVGVVACQTASPRHLAMITAAMDPANDWPAPPPALLGGMARNPALTLASRHLGLVQAAEVTTLSTLIDEARNAVATGLDLNGLLDSMTREANTAHANRRADAANLTEPPSPARFAPLGQRIAVAMDVACAFAYPHILDDWRAAGAQILPFSPLADNAPDAAADAIFLPGGYPELHAPALANGATWQAGVRSAAARGALIYGECGGFMLLGDALIDAAGTGHPMLGLLSHTTSFTAPKRTLGYRVLRHDQTVLPWPTNLRGHEFHYTSQSDGPRGTGYSNEAGKPAESPLFDAMDAVGTQLGPIGARRGNVAGSYAHVISPTVPPA